MGKGRKPKVDWEAVHELVDQAHEQPLSDTSHQQLKATVSLLEAYLADAKTSEKSDKLLGSNPKKPSKRKGGGGRNGADDHPAAEVRPVPHESLKHGGCCPDCGRGRVYECKKPAKDIRFEAQPLIKATVYERQRLKCSHCDATFTAAPPEGAGDENMMSRSRPPWRSVVLAPGCPPSGWKTFSGNLVSCCLTPPSGSWFAMRLIWLSL